MARLKKPIRWALYGVSGILLLLVAFVALIHTPPFKAYVLAKVAELLRARHIEVRASRLTYNLLEGTIGLTDVTVSSTTTPDLPAIAKVGSLSINVGLRQVIKGTYWIENARLENVELHVVVAEDGRDNIPKPPQQDNQQSGEIDYLIDQAAASGGSIVYEDRRQKILARLPAWRLVIDGNPATSKHDIRFGIDQPGSLGFQDRTLPLRDVNLHAILESSGVDVQQLQILTGESELALSGKINDFSDPRFDTRFNATLNLESLAEFAGIQQPIQGTIHAKIGAEGPLGKLRVTANLTGDDLAVRRLRGIDLNTTAIYDAARQRVAVPSLAVDAAGGSIRGSGDIALNTQAGQSSLNLTLRSINLETITRALDLPVQVASRASGGVSASFPGVSYEQATARANLNLAKTRTAAARNVLPVAGSLNATAQGRNVGLQINRIEALGAEGSGAIRVDASQRIGGQVTAQVGSLNQLMDGVGAFLGKGSGEALAGTKLDGPAQLTARLGGTIKNPQVSTAIAAQGVQVGQLSGIDVDVNLDYGSNRVQLHNADVKWRGQSVNVSGTVGLGSKNAPLNLNARIEQASIGDVLAGLNMTVPAQGTVTLRATVTGTTANPAADVTVNATDLVAYNEPLGTLTAEASLRDQLLTIPSLRLEKPDAGSLTASGSYNLDSKAYTVDAATENFTLRQMELPGNVPVRGTLNLQAKGAGTVADPNLDLTLSANDIQVRQDERGSVNLTAHVAQQQATVELRAPRYELAADAKVGINQPYPATFALHLNGTDLAQLPIPPEQQVTGKITGTIEGSGEITNWKEGQAQARIENLNVTYKGQPVRTEGPLVARYGSGRLAIEQATVVAAGSRLSVSGDLPLEQTAAPGAIDIKGQFDLASLSQYVPEQKIAATGQLALDGQIRGTLQRIDPNLTLALTNGNVSAPQLGAPLQDANLRLTVQNGTADLASLSAKWAGATITGQGQFPLGLLPADLPVEFPRQGGPANLAFDVAGLQLSAVPQVPEKITGAVSLHLEAQAPKPDLNALTARLTFPELNLNLAGLALQQQGVSTIAVNNGTARVEQFRITGSDTELQLSGSAELQGNRALDLRASGNMDAAVASLFTDAARTSGATRFEVAVSGTANDPRVNGFLAMSNGTLAIEEPRIQAQNLNLRVDMAGDQVTISSLTGDLNGGTLTGGGAVQLKGGEVGNLNLNLQTKDVYLDYPNDFRTLSSADIKIASQPTGEILVGGQVRITEGSFTDDINLDQGLMSVLSSTPEVEITRERNPLLSRIRFGVDVDTDSPLVVDNNLAKAAITMDLRLLGTIYRPGMSGRIVLEEGGELYLNERTYLVDRGVITFTSDQKIAPSLDILARTSAAGYDITLQVQGDPGDMETTLTSDPALPEPDIIAVLLTGRTIEEIRGAEIDVAKEQLLSYLTGRFTGTLSRQLENTLGLSQVRIEPNLIAAEENPTARLTVGQDITSRLGLVYSMNLTNSSDQIWMADYDLTKRFNTRVTKQSDNSYRMEFRHNVEFGGGISTAADRLATPRRDRKIGTVDFHGNTVFTSEQLRDRLGLRTGKDYDFFKIRKGLDKVEKAYAKQDLLEAKVRMERETTDDTVNLNVQVEAGKRIQFVYEGWGVPGGVEKDVREIWREGVFDAARAEDAIDVIEAALVKDGYVRSKITYQITQPTAEVKRVLFDIQPGVRYSDVKLVFEGATGVKPSTLEDLVDQQKLKDAVYTDPGDVIELLQNYYREQGYLDVKVDKPRYELNADTRTGQVVMPIQEGPLYHVGKLEFQGNQAVPSTQLAAELPLKSGQAYLPRQREASIGKLEEIYQARAYNESEFQYTLRKDSEGALVDVTFQITENKQSVVESLTISGNDRTSENLIRTQLALKPGELLTLAGMSQSRRNLYNTGAYSLVYIEREEVPNNTLRPDQRSMRVAVRVQEIRPFRLQYGAFFDTERGPGGILDLANRNSLGSARVLGLRLRYDARLKEGRVYFSQPLLERFPLRTLASGYRTREIRGEIDTGFQTDRIGFTFQQESRFWKNYVLNYGYRLENTHTIERTPDPILPLDDRLRVAPLTLSLTRETRDDLLDATRGSFTSHSIEYAPSLLGSQLRYVRYFGQFFKYIPLSQPTQIPWSNARKSRLVYAGALRFGAATGLGGQDLILSERFFAGGGTTIRGFQQDFAGPLNSLGEPIGGDAMLVINNELRFPLFSIFDGASFIDVGNVFPSVTDIRLPEIRRTAGVGIRVRTPYFLLRLDYGFKLDKRPGETSGRLFFSIGQAF